MEAKKRVGIGWHGGHCFVCDPCRRGDFIVCKNEKVTGFDFDGGYAEYMIAREEAVAAIPDGLDSAEAGPLLCAGITTYNTLRHPGARPGDTVAILGIGGLGHLGIQYVRQMGFRTVAIGRGPDKGGFVETLGAHEHIDTEAGAPAAALQKLGGANVASPRPQIRRRSPRSSMALRPTAGWSSLAPARSRSISPPISSCSSAVRFKVGLQGPLKIQKTRCNSVCSPACAR